MQNQKIEELTTHLELLHIQIEEVSNRIRAITRENNNVTRVRRGIEIRVGDTVQVTNKYKGRLGVKGVVIRLTATQSVIESETGETFRKYKANLKIVEE